MEKYFFVWIKKVFFENNHEKNGWIFGVVEITILYFKKRIRIKKLFTSKNRYIKCDLTKIKKYDL